jgi:hypothetical protein
LEIFNRTARGGVMLYTYRIKRLQRKIDVQEQITELAKKAEYDYGNSYYTNICMDEFKKLYEMRSNLKYLKDKVTGK